MIHPLKKPVESDLPDDRDGLQELAERYQRLRQNTTSPPRSEALRHDSAEPGYRDLISARPAAAYRAMPPRNQIGEPGRDYRDERRSAPPRPDGGGYSLRKTYVLAALAAVLTGASAGYTVAQFDHISGKVHGLFASSAAQTLTVTAALPAAKAATVIAKKPVATATLTVADVSGGLNSFIPLALHAEPAIHTQDLILKISGLPDTAYLTAGKKHRDNSWALTMNDLKDVKLVVPTASAPKFDVAVAAFETGSGVLAAPVKEMTVALTDPSLQITPTAAPPEVASLMPAATGKSDEASAIPLPTGVTAASASPAAEVTGLLGKGDLLMKSGDLQTARQFYERAFAKGSAAGALGLGKTYDPTVFADLNVQGLKPDTKLAIEWYTRAVAAGSAEAPVAIARLKQQPD